MRKIIILQVLEVLALLVAEDDDDGEYISTSGWVVVVVGSLGGTEHPSQTSSSLI